MDYKGSPVHRDLSVVSWFEVTFSASRILTRSTYQAQTEGQWFLIARRESQSTVAAPLCSAPYAHFQSQRDCVLQPRVARNELPWVPFRKTHQPQRGCVTVRRALIPHVRSA